MQEKKTFCPPLRSLLAVLLILALHLADAAVLAEGAVPLASDGKPLARILSMGQGFIATDVNGTTWAWGKGGPSLGIPGLAEDAEVKKPTLLAIKNVIDVKPCNRLTAFLTSDGEVWLAGTPYAQWNEPGKKQQKDLRRVPIEGVKAISLTVRDEKLIEDEMLLMLKEDGSLWLRSEKGGLAEVKTEAKIRGLGPGGLTLIHEDGVLYQYSWSKTNLKCEKPVPLPRGGALLESGLAYALDEDGVLYQRTYMGGYKRAWASPSGNQLDLPEPDNRKIRKLYNEEAVLYDDGRVFVRSNYNWAQVEGTYADMKYSYWTHGRVLLMDKDGNVSVIEGKKKGYDDEELTTDTVKTSLHLYQAAPAPKAAKLPGEDDYLPDGTVRAQASVKVYSAKSLVSKYKAKKKKGIPLYKPSAPQPLNVLLATADGHVKLNIDGPDNLDEWADRLVTASQGALRVVASPDQAEVLLTFLRKYPKRTYHTKSGKKVPVYDCTMTITATLLTDTKKQASLSDKNIAPNSYKIPSDAIAGMQPEPEFAKFPSLVSKILDWYGLNCKQGSKGDGVKRVQQALKTRAFYSGKISGAFDAASEQALKAFQQSLGLDPTGTVDRETLVWLYYD